MNKALYLSEEFTKEKFSNMERGHNYCFFAEPDSGKTSMIAKNLQPLAEERNEKILFLYPRKSIGEQTAKKFRDSSIDCMSYQKLEKLIKKGAILPRYDYIVCDEAHYFVEDANINFDTELSFDFINNENESVKIILTGTPEPLEFVSWNRPLIIERQVNILNNNVEVVFLSKSNKAIDKEIIQKLNEGEQSLVFHSSATEAYELSKDFLKYNPFFICSLGNKSFRNRIDMEARNQIINEERTGRPIGFLTSAMNTGINFNEDIRNVVILGSPSAVDIRQSVARVRRGDSSRKIRLYIQVPHGNSFNAKLRELRKELEYIEIGNDSWKEKYGRNALPSYVYYVDEKGSNLAERKINQLRLAKVKSDEQYFSLVASNPEQAYKSLLGEYYPNAPIHWLKGNSKAEDELIRTISVLEDEILLKEEQEALKQLFKAKGVQSKKGTIGPKTIKEWLEKNTDFRLEVNRISINGKKPTYWKIVRK